MPVCGEGFCDLGGWGADDGVVVVWRVDDAVLSAHCPAELQVGVIELAGSDVCDGEDSAGGVGVVGHAPDAFAEAFEGCGWCLAVDSSCAGVVVFDFSL